MLALAPAILGAAAVHAIAAAGDDLDAARAAVDGPMHSFSISSKTFCIIWKVPLQRLAGVLGTVRRTHSVASGGQLGFRFRV